MVLKRTEMFVFGGGTLRLLSPDSSGQLDIFWHDGDSPGMNGTPQVCLEVLGDLPHQPLERQFPDEQC